jgi:hypothetical protein
VKAARHGRYACVGIGAILSLALSVPARAGGPDAEAPQDRRDVFGKALRQFEAAGARERAHPDSLGPHLDRLRLAYVLGVRDEAYLADADREAGWLAARSRDDADRLNLARAYRGAIAVARAKHGFNPNRKLRHLKAGGPPLDSAVAAAPGDAEVRYLRLVSAYYLPFFLGRRDSVRADFAALARILPGVTGEFPPGWYLAIAGFVMDKGRLEPEARDRLARRMREAEAAEAGRAGGSAL